MTNKARIAFGAEERVDAALEAGTIDEYDLLLLDGGKIGWIDKTGQKVMANTDKQIISVSELPTSDVKEDVVYVFEEKAYVWNGAKFVCLSTNVDVSALEAEIATKVDEATVDEKINTAIDSMAVDVVEF